MLQICLYRRGKANVGTLHPESRKSSKAERRKAVIIAAKWHVSSPIPDSFVAPQLYGFNNRRVSFEESEKPAMLMTGKMLQMAEKRCSLLLCNMPLPLCRTRRGGEIKSWLISGTIKSPRFVSVQNPFST